jgi:hypothetical protein
VRTYATEAGYGPRLVRKSRPIRLLQPANTGGLHARLAIVSQVGFDAAKRLAIRGVSDDEAARSYEVSVELARWRVNATGARIIAACALSRRHKM